MHLTIFDENWSFVGSKSPITRSNPLIRKESRNSYDEHAKYHETSAKNAKADGKEPG